MSKFKIEITSIEDRDNLVAEIWYDETMIAEINQERNILELELYNLNRFSCNLQEFLNTLETAKRKLIGG